MAGHGFLADLRPAPAEPLAEETPLSTSWALVNTWITRGQNCHSRPSTKAGHDAGEGAVLPGIVAFSEGVAHTPSRLPETSRAGWSGYFLLARLPDLREIPAGGWPRSAAVAIHERYGVHYPQLVVALRNER
jgi:hypothetical protein